MFWPGAGVLVVFIAVLELAVVVVFWDLPQLRDFSLK
jgi:hypothetical protein